MNWIYICKDQIQPRFVENPSSSRPGLVHTTVAKTVFSDSFCECEGFQYRGYCKHTEAADESYCRWFTLAKDKEIPRQCPLCGGEVIRYTFDLEFDDV